MSYPDVLGEATTLEAILSGRSIARYGDGELRVALGRSCVSQEADPKLAAELRAILADPQDGLLVGIPNIVNSGTPKAESWSRFARAGYTVLYKQTSYASSFITRPDSAPWIDTAAYWDRVHDLWRGKDVLLIAGDRKSIRIEDLAEAKTIRVIEAPRQHAYQEIDRIEEEICGHPGPIIMCLGCTATALAARLHKKGLWGIDLGHIGMFMRHAGIYNIALDSLASIKYRHELQRVHEKQTWGQRGDRHAGDVFGLISRVHEMKGPGFDLGKVTVLDYGCGRGALKEALKPHRVQEYDPGIRGKDILPKPCDIVVCTDVLEHVEPKALGRVIDHLCKLTGYIAHLVIATRPANLVLPSGRNAHLIIQDAEWWASAIRRAGWNIETMVNKSDKEVTFTLLKKRT